MLMNKIAPAAALFTAALIPCSAVYAADSTKIGYGQGTAVDQFNRPCDAAAQADTATLMPSPCRRMISVLSLPLIRAMKTDIPKKYSIPLKRKMLLRYSSLRETTQKKNPHS